MILFIFEGTKREPRLFKTLEYLFFPKNCEHIVCYYGNNIYNLYKRMSETDFDEDIVAILMEKYREEGGGSFAGIEKRSDISEVYLFFDYDNHNQNSTKTLALCDLNEQLQKMLDFFTDETEHGKLYINYPMIESIRYTKELPDPNYCSYKIHIENCNRFKELASEFSFYKDLDFISFRIQKRTGTLKIPPEVQVKNIKANWKHLVKQNSEKAYSMMEGNLLPCQKGSVHSQKSIFEAQLSGFVNNDNSIAVLNAMPLFLEDYFGCKIHNPN